MHRLGLWDRILPRSVDITKNVVHSTSGSVLNEVDVASEAKKQTGFGYLRINRADLVQCLRDAAEEHSIPIYYDKQIQSIENHGDSVTVTFTDGTSDTGTLLLGCDGIHSVTRLKHVEPTRTSNYSGICNAFGFAPRRKDATTADGFEPVHFTTTGMNFGRRGILLTSFHDSAKESIYVGALMQVPEIESRDGWKKLLDVAIGLAGGTSVEDDPSASGAWYLTRIRVKGYQGIGDGPFLEIELDPTPGITVIHGANGSGKSSIADAIETALQGRIREPALDGLNWTQRIARHTFSLGK